MSGMFDSRPQAVREQGDSTVDWFFSGLGTFLIGLVLGGGGGTFVGYRLRINSNRQTQKAGDNATQTMVGRGDIKDSRGR